MKKDDIKTIMIVHNDNDFVRVWNWIGKILLSTLIDKNICNEEMLEDSEDIEKFVLSLLPIAIEFAQYKVGKYEKYNRYRDISDDELNYLVSEFKKVKFKYNFDKNDSDFKFGGSETLIIDLVEHTSDIR